MTVQRWKLLIEYDGRPFSGWQYQEHVISVQRVIEEAIQKFCQQDIRIHAAGRTDAGVHAYGQVAHFDLDYGQRDISGFELAKAINAHLGDHPASVVMAERVDSEFHARFSAVSKLYMYRILNRSARPALEAGRVWHVKRALDIDSMQEGIQHFIGTHDFTTFRATDCQAKNPVRSLTRAEVVREDDEIRFYFEGRSFLHHQVRNMVGTLALIGEGKWQPDDIVPAMAARDRARGGPTAPPDGLYLMNVQY